MSETSSATPRETLPVSTTSSTVVGSASAIRCAIARNSTLRAVAVTRTPYFGVSCLPGTVRQSFRRKQPRRASPSQKTPSAVSASGRSNWCLTSRRDVDFAAAHNGGVRHLVTLPAPYLQARVQAAAESAACSGSSFAAFQGRPRQFRRRLGPARLLSRCCLRRASHTRFRRAGRGLTRLAAWRACRGWHRARTPRLDPFVASSIETVQLPSSA